MYELTKLKRVPFYFIRHGETEWNKQKRIMGQTDISLNLKGKSQAQESIALIKNLGIKNIISSPLSRAKETAKIINQFLQVPFFEDEGLKEKNSGNLQGFSYNIGDSKRQEIIDEWEGKSIPIGAEDWEIFYTRTFKAINKYLELNAPILIVAHGGNYRALNSLVTHKLEEIPNCVPIHLIPYGENENWALTHVE